VQTTDTNIIPHMRFACRLTKATNTHRIYEGWNFNSGNYLFTTDTK